MRKKTEIYSIFGQIEAVIAESFIEKGLGKRIAPDIIPESARFNEQGQPAQFALIIDQNLVGEFERQIRNLRA